ncbi:MAG: glycine/sarcosine/betaine reductase complex component C subunit beta [Dehalococcoidia bacterium]
MVAANGTAPVIKGITYCLAHVPDLVRHGSKPSRDIPKDPALLDTLLQHWRGYEDAVAYPPHQVFLGNLRPDDLKEVPQPWYENPIRDGGRFGPYGEITPQEEFYGWMKISDQFELMLLEKGFVGGVRELMAQSPMVKEEDLGLLGSGVPIGKIEETLSEGIALPLYVEKTRLVGCFQRGHEEDKTLTPEFLIENLAAKASAVVALRHAIDKVPDIRPTDIDYLLGCGEEAIGDRYNRGGGNLAKAIGEMCGCINATGSDVKAFCCAPNHAIIMGGALIQAGVFKEIAVVGGGSFAKLGMKYRGHVTHNMPILEDVLASTAILMGPDDGENPRVRLDIIGKHDISSGSSNQAITQAVVVDPLKKHGLKITDIDRYATELHNPEITEPQGSGNTPRTNYRILGSMAVKESEIEASALDQFVEDHGMVGFSPTQGHIASAVPFLGHARDMILSGQIEKAMFYAKGSLFLGRMTNLADGISFVLERNGNSKISGK